MKKNLLIICLIGLISFSLLFVGCASKSSDTAKSPAVQKTFTMDELKKYDGKNGNAAYVAVNGTVYDVTNEKKWKTGMHEGNVAGTDLSKLINSSPHGKDILKGVPVVGTLK